MKSLKYMFITLLCASASFAAPTGKETLQQAKADLKAGRYSQLDQRYESSLKEGTKGSVLSCLTMQMLGIPSNIPDLEKWTKSKPKSPSAWASLGLAYLAQAKKIRQTAPRSKEFKAAYAKAETYCDKAYGLSPKDINMSSFQIECRKVGGWGRRK
jgi:hypothetical protein